MNKLRICIFLALALLSGQAMTQNTPWIISAPAGDRPTQIVRGGQTVIPNGRIVTPRGKIITTAPHPYGLVLSPDGTLAATANTGIRPFSVTLIRNPTGDNPGVLQIPDGVNTDKGVLAAVYMGVAISPDNKKIYVAGGQEGKIYVFDPTTRAKLAEINCNDSTGVRPYSSSYPGDLVLSRDGQLLYVVDQINFRLMIINTATQKVVRSIGVGRYPFGVALSPDETRAYVVNVGMYEYKIAYRFKPADPAGNTRNGRQQAALGSPEAAAGIRNADLQVPPLGDPLAPEAFSVFAIDLKTDAVIAKIKTGTQVGQLLDGVPAVGGSSPNSVVATDDYVFVSNGHSDCVTMIDAKSLTKNAEIALSPEPRLKNLRGLIPFGLAISPDQKRLYVAEAGINAVGVIDVPTRRVIGHLPTGWFPSKLQVSRDGKKLLVANAKGYGSGPNGGSTFAIGHEGSYIGNLMKGTVSVMTIPADDALAAETQQVLSNNFTIRPANDLAFAARKNNPVPLYPAPQSTSPIKHVVFILKENRTYDEVFGQLPGGNGEAALARFGYGGATVTTAVDGPIGGLTPAPNHLALAKQFAIADNFYVDSDVSADGHRWLIGLYPNEWVEVNTMAQYGGARAFKMDSTAPGALVLMGAGSPEDINEAGSIWDHLYRLGTPFYNFGMTLQNIPTSVKAAFLPTDERIVTNLPAPEGLLKYSSLRYPSYNTNIPDQFRADMFMQDFAEKWSKGAEKMPAFTTIRLGNDHGAGLRPEAGYPHFQSYMADNDLALGRIVEYLSQTPYWKNMLIVVTEDDAQGGVDHVDAHRSVLMLISPYVRRNYIGHGHSSFGSIFKTFWNCLGVPYLNQYDASATDLADFFTDRPDFTPYKALPVDPELFNPEKALDPYDRDFDWAALTKSPEMDNVPLMQRMSTAAEKERAAQQPFAPYIAPMAGDFKETLRVEMNIYIGNADIRYTLDGTEPKQNSPLYQAPIEINANTTVKARAFYRDGKSSRVATRVYRKMP
jgi:YVTN family beta-propeller protein